MRGPWPVAKGDEWRWAWIALVSAMAVASALILWLGRGMTFWGDELAWMLESPHLDLNAALQPHEGHLVLTTHLVYKLLFETFGTAYLPFRLLTLGAILLTVGLFFVYAARRLGPILALAPSLLLLVFSGDALHVFFGNGFTVLLAVACGLGALLLLEHDRARCDLGACSLLCLGIATYSVALAFVVGAAAAILLAGSRRRLWVVAIPAALYTAWWLWSSGSGGRASLSKVLLLPAWGFQSLSATLASLSGLDFEFSTGSPSASVGPALAVAALLVLAWRFRRRPIPGFVWVAATVLVNLWLLQVLVSVKNGGRLPDESRYLYPSAIAVLLVVVAAAGGVRPSRRGTFLLFAVVVSCVAVNLSLLRERANELRGIDAVQTRAALTGLELADRRIDPRFSPPPLPGLSLPLLGPQSPLGVPFSALPTGESAAKDFPEAVERYGKLGYSPDQLRAQGEPAGAQADFALVGALGLKLTHIASVAGARRHCVTAAAGIGTNPTARAPRGGAVLRAGREGAEVEVRRFSRALTSRLGTLSPGQVAALRIPVDQVATPWRVYVPRGQLTVCPLP